MRETEDDGIGPTDEPLAHARAFQATEPFD